jgi:hypothetical protein
LFSLSISGCGSSKTFPFSVKISFQSGIKIENRFTKALN